MNPYMLGLYIALCLILGVAGRHSRLGAVGIFLLSLVFTPILVGMILVILRPLPRLSNRINTKHQPDTER